MKRIILMIGLLLVAFPVLAEEKPGAVAPKETAKVQETKEAISETSHSARISGKTIEYRALAGEIQLKDEKDKQKAVIFYVAYLAKNQETKQRPLTFIFNGGPGSSSVWLHMGALGPKRVAVDENGFAGSPPYELAPNEYSLLDVSDLVFIDPVSTGFSRAADGEEAKQFHEVQKDVESFGEFIRIFITRHERWGSPLYIAGESYGTIRGAGLVDYLQRRHGIYFNGIVLISPAMNTQAHRDFEGNDLPYIVALPAYTAAAWYYKKLEPGLQQNLYKAMEASRKFAEERYSVALFKGSAISAEERSEIVRELAKFTALPSEKIEQENLRISRFFFARNLLQKEQKQIGVLDSRYSSFNNSMPLESFADMYAYTVMDPASNVDGIFTSTFQQYLRKDLKYVTEKNYEVLSIPVAYSWDYSSSANRYLNTADNLRTAMTMNPDLKVFVAGGYYDLVTTPFSADYIVSHLNVHPDLQKNIQTHYYESGHMMYLHYPSLIKLKSDLANFYSGK